MDRIINKLPGNEILGISNSEIKSEIFEQFLISLNSPMCL